jgi:hypothetical protein
MWWISELFCFVFLSPYTNCCSYLNPAVKLHFGSDNPRDRRLHDCQHGRLPRYFESNPIRQHNEETVYPITPSVRLYDGTIVHCVSTVAQLYTGFLRLAPLATASKSRRRVF